MKKPIVLVIDDEIKVTEMISDLSENIDVLAAANFEDAVNIISSVELAAIACDHFLPNGKTSFDLIRFIQSENKCIPLAVMSGGDPPDYSVEEKHEVLKFFKKPFKLTDLLGWFSEIISMQKGEPL